MESAINAELEALYSGSSSRVIDRDSFDGMNSRTLDGIEQYLSKYHNTTIKYDQFDDLLAYLTTAPRANNPKILLVNGRINKAERLYLYVHIASHLILGHTDRPFATIVEPKPEAYGTSIQIKPWERLQGIQADSLACAILFSASDDTIDAIWEWGSTRRDNVAYNTFRSEVCELRRFIPTKEDSLTKKFLASGWRRGTLLGGFRFLRVLYHFHQKALKYPDSPFIRKLRRCYWLMELAAFAPAEALANALGKNAQHLSCTKDKSVWNSIELGTNAWEMRGAWRNVTLDEEGLN